MANQNFVVHNGLSVGSVTIDAATSNIAIPVTKQLAIGNIILRDNGDGKLHARDITDNNDAIIVATISAPSVTQGNIQIGTNHIESTNANGPISLRPNGTGTLVFAANLISAGKGAAELTIATGLAMPAEYGVTYANANIQLSPGRDGLYSGNVRVTQTTPATGPATGAFQVMGGASIAKDLWVTGNVYTANLVATTYGYLSINDPLLYLTANATYPYNYDIGFYSQFTGGTGNTYQHTGFVRDNVDNSWKLFSNAGEPTAGEVNFTGVVWDNLVVGNVLPGISNLATLGSTTNWFSKTWSLAVNAQYADLAEKYQADSAYEPGTVLMFGGDAEVTVADVNTPRVAGVVSTQPGYLMNGSLANETAIELALTGRVPCKVTGTVRKGDLMTSAGGGYAHANPDAKMGTVIGKALEDHDGLEGVIEVVVGRL